MSHETTLYNIFDLAMSRVLPTGEIVELVFVSTTSSSSMIPCLGFQTVGMSKSVKTVFSAQLEP